MTKLGKHKKQGKWRLMIVYLQLNIIENTKLGEPALLGSKKIDYEYAREMELKTFVKNILDL